MSVWVEIDSFSVNFELSKSRSTWACELKYAKSHYLRSKVESRSTWACELKLSLRLCWIVLTGHAPRERVSWNLLSLAQLGLDRRHAPRERVSWNFLNTSFWREKCVTLHVSVWVEIEFEIKHINLPLVTLHVSVWVEMIAIRSLSHFSMVTLHVSVWVEMPWLEYIFLTLVVTLHVSVWVEIVWRHRGWRGWLSRSTWACELKWWNASRTVKIWSHAPRERVSWN